MSAQSYLNLKQQVIELVAVNEALSEKLAAFIADHETTVAELTEKLAVAEHEREQFRRWWHDERVRTKDLEERGGRYEQERDAAREETQRLRWNLIGTEREREAARAHAESMRERAFPTAPQFPWEGTTVVHHDAAERRYSR